MATTNAKKYDSKAPGSVAKNFVKVTVLVETQKGRYAKTAQSAKDVALNIEDIISDNNYDGLYGRTRIVAETLTEKSFQEAYDA